MVYKGNYQTSYDKAFKRTSGELPTLSQVNSNLEDHLKTNDTLSHYNTTYNQEFKPKDRLPLDPQKKVLRFKSGFYNDKSQYKVKPNPGELRGPISNPRYLPSETPRYAGHYG